MYRFQSTQNTLALSSYGTLLQGVRFPAYRREAIVVQ